MPVGGDKDGDREAPGANAPAPCTPVMLSELLPVPPSTVLGLLLPGRAGRIRTPYLSSGAGGALRQPAVQPLRAHRRRPGAPRSLFFS